MNIFVISSISDLILSEIATADDDVLVCSDNENVLSQMKHLNCKIVYLRRGSNGDWRNSDMRFCDEGMAGSIFDFPVPTTLLPLYKIIGIDRLHFWFEGDGNNEIGQHLFQHNADRCTISLDIYSSLPWTAKNIFSSRGVPITYIKTHSLRSLPLIDGMRNGLLGECRIVVSNNLDTALIRQVVNNDVAVVARGFRRVPTESEIRNAVGDARNLANVPRDARIATLIFDKQYEHEFSRMARGVIGNCELAYIFPVDKRSLELFNRMYNDTILSAPVVVTDNFMACRVADTVISFGWASYLEGIEASQVVLDPGGRTHARELSGGLDYIEVVDE